MCIEIYELWVFGHYSGKCEVFCLHENSQMKISSIYNGQNMILNWRQIFEIKSSQQQNQVKKKNTFQIRTGLPLESQLFQIEENTIVDIKPNKQQTNIWNYFLWHFIMRSGIRVFDNMMIKLLIDKCGAKHANKNKKEMDE